MVANIMDSRKSHGQTAQDVFDFAKGHVPSYPVLKFCDNLSSRNRDMAQNVILLGCDLERSRSSMKVIKFLSDLRHLLISTHEVSSKSYYQFYHYGRAIVDRR